MAKNQFQMHILWFFFHADVKMWNLKIQKRTYLAAMLVQNVRSVENKVESLERQCYSEKLSFIHKKETEHSFELSLSICVFYLRIFNLEMQNFSLENHHMMNARQPFC